jgi:cobalt-zinc-cadmium efflux system outer membrane protein
LLRIYPHKQIVAVGPVMRPTSPSEGSVNPSTGPRSTPQPTPGTVFPSDTPLQQDTNPTVPLTQPANQSGLPQSATPAPQDSIQPLTIPPGQQLPVRSNPDVVKATIRSDQPGQSGGQSITLADALDEALARSPRAAAVRAQLPVAKSGIAQATVTPNPVFFMDRGFVAESVERRGPSITWDPPFKLYLRMIAAKRLYAQTKIDLMTTLWQLRADTRRAYTEAVVARETQKTLVDLYELSNRLLTVASKRFQAGDVPELDVLRARLAISQSMVDVGVGQQRVVRASQQLNVILGRVVEAEIGVPTLPDFTGKKPTSLQLKAIKRGILPDFNRAVPPLQEFLKIALENRLELASLAQQIKVNDANFNNAIGAAVPNPGVAYGSSKNGNLPSGPKLSATFLTLNIETPVTNLNQGDLAKYKATGKQLTYQVAAQKNQVMADVSSAYNNLLAAREKIRVYQEHVLADSAEVARLSRRSYEVGQSDINSTLLAQQANVQIRQSYLDAVTSYQGAYTDLEQACGSSLE